MGIQLIPVIAESFSGWGPKAQDALGVIAKASATRSGLSLGVVTSKFYEGLSSIIMRANARAMLARVGMVETAPTVEAQARAQEELR